MRNKKIISLVIIATIFVSGFFIWNSYFERLEPSQEILQRQSQAIATSTDFYLKTSSVGPEVFFSKTITSSGVYTRSAISPLSHSDDGGKGRMLSPEELIEIKEIIEKNYLLGLMSSNCKPSLDWECTEIIVALNNKKAELTCRYSDPKKEASIDSKYCQRFLSQLSEILNSK